MNVFANKNLFIHIHKRISFPAQLDSGCGYFLAFPVGGCGEKRSFDQLCTSTPPEKLIRS